MAGRLAIFRKKPTRPQIEQPNGKPFFLNGNNPERRQAATWGGAGKISIANQTDNEQGLSHIKYHISNRDITPKRKNQRKSKKTKQIYIAINFRKLHAIGNL